MANSNTDHSKKLRAESANKTKKEKLARGEYKKIQIQGKGDLIDKVKNELETLDIGAISSKNLEKIAFLIDFYKNKS